LFLQLARFRLTARRSSGASCLVLPACYVDQSQCIWWASIRLSLWLSVCPSMSPQQQTRRPGRQAIPIDCCTALSSAGLGRMRVVPRCQRTYRNINFFLDLIIIVLKIIPVNSVLVLLSRSTLFLMLFCAAGHHTAKSRRLCTTKFTFLPVTVQNSNRF